ncbi:MAG: nuclear transport factor 2 family protein [Longimicrobiales bacterium]|nr:nuclear transport factor 2 family protein [Longimicrobiales bacterium]
MARRCPTRDPLPCGPACRIPLSVLLLALLPAGLLAQSGAGAGTGAGSTGADREAVLGVVRTLFDGMRQKDEALLRSVFHPEARLHTAATDAAGAPATPGGTAEAFVGRVLAGRAHLDEVTFDEVVLVEGNLAMAWTPYNLFVDGAFQHCGVDLFVMTRAVGGWEILQLVDTRRRDGCDPERRG